MFVGQDCVTELVQALQAPLRNQVFQQLLGAHIVRHRDALDEHGDDKVVAVAAARLFVEVVDGHLAELGRAVHHAHGIVLVQQNYKVLQAFARVGRSHMSNIEKT